MSGRALGPTQIRPTIALAMSIARDHAPLFRAVIEASTYPSSTDNHATTGPPCAAAYSASSVVLPNPGGAATSINLYEPVANAGSRPRRGTCSEHTRGRVSFVSSTTASRAATCSLATSTPSTVATAHLALGWRPERGL